MSCAPGGSRVCPSQPPRRATSSTASPRRAGGGRWRDLAKTVRTRSSASENSLPRQVRHLAPEPDHQLNAPRIAMARCSRSADNSSTLQPDQDPEVIFDPPAQGVPLQLCWASAALATGRVLSRNHCSGATCAGGRCSRAWTTHSRTGAAPGHGSATGWKRSVVSAMRAVRCSLRAAVCWPSRARSADSPRSCSCRARDRYAPGQAVRDLVPVDCRALLGEHPVDLRTDQQFHLRRVLARSTNRSRVVAGAQDDEAAEDSPPASCAGATRGADRAHVAAPREVQQGAVALTSRCSLRGARDGAQRIPPNARSGAHAQRPADYRREPVPGTAPVGAKVPQYTLSSRAPSSPPAIVVCSRSSTNVPAARADPYGADTARTTRPRTCGLSHHPVLGCGAPCLPVQASRACRRRPAKPTPPSQPCAR